MWSSSNNPQLTYRNGVKRCSGSCGGVLLSQEMAFREFEAACDQNPTCSLQKTLARLKCIRECISPVCYQQIYFQDQLEDGEIDVRLNSFKGCFVQRAGRR